MLASKTSNINFGVIGFGCIGSYICHLLDDSKTSVFVRELQSSDEHEISIDNKSYKLPAKIQLLSKLSLACINVLIVPIKSHQNDTLITQLKGIISSHTQIVLLQNGISGVEQFKSAFPNHTIYVGISTDGLYRVSPSNVRLAGRGDFVVGVVQSECALSTHQKSALMQLIHAHPNGRWCEQIELPIYKKLLVNAVVNPLTFIQQCKNGELAKYRLRCQVILDEVMLVYAALNIEFDAVTWSQTVFDVIQSTANNTSSMLQDRQNQQATEVDAILGALIKKAALHKVNTPLLTRLYDQVKTIEKGYLASKQNR